MHRLPGGERARVFALRPDLDAWWNSRGIHIPAEEESEHESATPKVLWRGRVWLAALVAAAVLAALGYWLWSGIGTPPPQLRVTPLTSLLGSVFPPSFSPDGKQIAFTWNEVPKNFDIWIKDLAGGEPRRLTTNPARESLSAGSPDGHLIAFLRFDIVNLIAGGQLLVVPQTGGSERVLLNNIPIPELDPIPVVS